MKRRAVSFTLEGLAKHAGEPFSGAAFRAAQFVEATVLTKIYLRACNRVGSNAQALGSPQIVNEGRIELGSDVRLVSRWKPILLSTRAHGAIVIGDGAVIDYGTIVTASSLVRIGSGAQIGNSCVIADTQIPGMEPELDEVARPIEIGEGARLGARVTVLPGATIGAGAIVAVGSVVDGDIPAGALAGGVPARVLREVTAAGEGGIS
jgi:acetyltransferase-like isoleucine patch superfamily enzyme